MATASAAGAGESPALGVSAAVTTPTLAHLLPPLWRSTVVSYLHDDCPSFDVGGFVVGDAPETAVLLAKSATVLAGVPFFSAVFEELGCTIEWLKGEGEFLEPPCRVAYVRGPCKNLLLGERTALNCLTRASGVATLSHKFVQIAKNAKWHGEIAATRKVTPGSFRIIEKYAVLVGGASTHRMDLSSMVMLKDNHVWAAGSIAAAVKSARSVAGFSSKIDVEVRTLEEATEAAAAGADILMLDNYTPERMAAEGAVIKATFPHVMIEASGGITLASLPAYLLPVVDVVSVGALTHGYPCADYSLKILKGDGVATVAATEKSLQSTVAAAAVSCV